MHASSYDLMKQILGGLAHDGHIESGASVLDCGSAIANTGLQKSYRDLFASDVHYTGMDIAEGRNVDVVSDICSLDPATWYREIWNIVISGQMLEHVEFPLVAAQRMKRYVASGGWMVLIAPWQYGIHRYPIDCWRVLPDGMKFLFEGFENVETGVQGNDCWGIGQRPGGYTEPWTISRS